MSDDIVIRAEDVSKRYRISHLAGQATLRDTMHHAARLAWRRLRWNTKLSREDFWALRDINFEIKRGEVVGIIGRNGAGKSTLLKTLSRITEPTTGRITLKGRVASLLEVGTGFHPELTGRDNIFLNGAILGMSRVEIRKKFDEIVAFAEVERFLDTPVKRYSSGMYVRLAFAVAAHLEPEILIVDEVLAVGDAAFQKKCLGKMQDVASQQGRTILFVSHNLGTLQAICDRGLVMEQGRVAFDGDCRAAAAHYLREGRMAGAIRDFAGRDPGLRIDTVSFVATEAGPRLEIVITVRSSVRRELAVEFILTTSLGQPAVFAGAGTLDPTRLVVCDVGEHTQHWELDLGRIASGSYQLSAKLVIPMIQVLAHDEHPSSVEIHPSPEPPAVRVLEAGWQVGCYEVPARRL